MTYKELGATGLKVSEIGLGCEGFLEKDDAFTQDMFALALEQGVNCMDLYSPDPDMERDCAHFIQAQRWVPVAARLPEKVGWYLVFAVTFSDVAFFETAKGWRRLNTQEGRLEEFPYRVTHWMPLPKPPECEGKRKNKKYELRPAVCDWALDIPIGDATVALYFNSRNNAELVKSVLEWEDAHPNEAASYPGIAAAMAEQWGRLP